MKIEARKQRERQRKQEDFFSAAEKLFAAKGYDNTSVNDIAREAGYAAGTLYLYFSNKDELLVSLLESKLGEFEAAVEEKLATVEHPVDRFHALIRTQVQGLVERSKTFVVIFPILIQPKWWEKHDEEGRLRTIVEGKDRFLRSVLEDLQSSGYIKNVDIEFFLSAVMGMMNEFILCYEAKKYQHQFNPEEMAAKIDAYASAILGLPLPE
ncbi:MAG: TetR/AcrR family transcriptional regulator [Opitutales bacterium]|nr:TetR/AcrR family transcriptional regulator [Opitutales bacterium]